MDVDTDLHNFIQHLSQQQTVTIPPPNDPLPEDTSSPRLTDSIDFRVQVVENLYDLRLRALAKTFGNIPGVPIFTQWSTRKECSSSAVHRSILAGICGNKHDGAYSVALSNSYKDDEDGGDVIIYTGAGGRQKRSEDCPQKRFRLGPQILDQSWDTPSNNALRISFHTGNPVRVIRSWKCPSQYAPLWGYRYDGLYKVAACWTAKGCNGKKICRCRLERLPDQPPIPLRPITFPALRRPRKRLVSHPISYPLTSCTNDADAELNQVGTSVDTESDLGGLSSSPQQQEMCATGGVDPQVKVVQSSSHQHEISPRPLPTYRWDPKNLQLVKVSAARPVLDTADREERRGEDDATLVLSEDGRVDEPEW